MLISRYFVVLHTLLLAVKTEWCGQSQVTRGLPILPGGARTTDSNDVISTTADHPVTMKTDMIEHLFSLDLDFGMRCWKSLTLPQYSELMKKLTSDQMSCRCDLLPCEAYGMQVPPDVQRRKSSIVRDIRNQQILSILETSPEYTVLYSLVAVMGTAGKHNNHSWSCW